MTRRIIYTTIITLFIVSIASLVIAFSRGYRLNLEMKTISPTGILAASSQPDGASIWVNNKLMAATNASISLSPEWYDVRISKEGYQSWQKRIKILREVVNKAEALLIPTNPSLRAITAIGVLSPSLSPTGTKVAYIVPEKEASDSGQVKSKSGIWILDLRPGPLGRKSEPKQVYRSFSNDDLDNGAIFWSPDEKEIIIGFIQNEETVEKKADTPFYKALLISVANSVAIPTEVTKRTPQVFEEWTKTREQELKAKILERVDAPVDNLLLSSTTNVLFSPDENKVLYQATASAQIVPVITPPLIGSNPTPETRTIKEGEIYIYDIKEDKNFLLYEPDYQIDPKLLQWHSDSKHIFAIEKDVITIIDYDGTNKKTVYAGPHEKTIIIPSPFSSQVVILTNLNNPQNLPNLYELDLR